MFLRLIPPFVIVVSSFALCAADLPGSSGTSADESVEVHVADGFKVESVYNVPEEQGSWISITVDNAGRLITSDQQGLLYRVALNSEGRAEKVEAIRAFQKDEKGNAIGEPLGQAQGLAWVGDSLYIVVNGNAGSGSGLYRIRFSNNDAPGAAELLAAIPGAGEHGPHGVTLSPDGRWLYIAGGNDSGLPNIEQSRFFPHWGGDQLLSPETQTWDWHSKNGAVPGGWVCRTDLDGKHWEMFCSGFRNHYRLAFNADGELFTTDNDNEWQIGMPWYRPPRVCHVVSGGDFGWRSEALKWPAYFPDGLMAVADLPRGGPSGIVSGTGAKFPAKYQRALFALEWAFGKIYAIHLSPKGASYSGTIETFLSGRPMAIADATIGKDGALYFVVGGRNIESHIYRITYTGREDTSPVTASAENAARSQRRKLEEIHKRDAGAIEAAWPQLKSDDPAIRFAARVAIEQQDPNEWRSRVFSANHPQEMLTAAMALARTGTVAEKSKLLDFLGTVDWNRLSDAQRVELLRDYALVFIRMGKPDNAATEHAIKNLETQYPCNVDLVDRELCRVLVYLRAPNVVAKTLPLLLSQSVQEEKIQLAIALIEMRQSWTEEQLNLYSKWLSMAQSYRGGRDVHDTIAELIRQVLDASTPEQKNAISTLLNSHKADAVEPKPRKIVKKWTVDDLLPVVKEKLKDGDPVRGGLIYHEASCIKCHYFKNEGTGIGPDLTSVSARFNLKSILESTVEPSKVIADQYAAKVIKMRDGRTLVGRVLCESNSKYQFAADPLVPDKFVDIAREDVLWIKNSPVSIMPENLLDMFEQNEIVDLIAYLESEGSHVHADVGVVSIKGRVIYNGKARAPKVAPIPAEFQAGCQHDKIPSDDFVFDPATNGLRWAIVRVMNVKGPPDAAKFAPLTINQQGCAFTPHALVVPPGGDVEVLNPDKIGHNVHIVPLDLLNKSLNTMMGATDEKLVLKGEKYFTEPEVIRIQCDIHPWMKCYVAVHDPRYAAVSGADGEFEIKNVPSGRYEMVITHELGEKRIKVEVKAGETTDLETIDFGEKK